MFGVALCTLIALIARTSHGAVLASLDVEAVDPIRPFDGAEELAERVRYSDLFEVKTPLLVVEAEGRANLGLSLVEETHEGPPAVAETALQVRGRARGRFAGVEAGRYRLMVVAEGHGPVHLRLTEGAVSPIWAVSSAVLVMLPALLATRQWMRGRILG